MSCSYSHHFPSLVTTVKFFPLKKAFLTIMHYTLPVFLRSVWSGHITSFSNSSEILLVLLFFFFGIIVVMMMMTIMPHHFILPVLHSPMKMLNTHNNYHVLHQSADNGRESSLGRQYSMSQADFFWNWHNYSCSRVSRKTVQQVHCFLLHSHKAMRLLPCKKENISLSTYRYVF